MVVVNGKLVKAKNGQMPGVVLEVLNVVEVSDE